MGSENHSEFSGDKDTSKPIDLAARCFSIHVESESQIKSVKTSIERSGLARGKLDIQVARDSISLQFVSNAGLEEIQTLVPGHDVKSTAIVQESSVDPIISKLPKRFSIYPPMILLPSSTQADTFKDFTRQDYEHVLSHFTRAHSPNRQLLTHIAINNPIPLQSGAQLASEDDFNAIRSPSKLITLYGDNFDALWVHTMQNGLYQYWMPRYTMFSRGNIKEKYRILQAEKYEHTLPGQTDPAADTRLVPYAKIADQTVLDLYVGIGYFTLSYLKRGARRVICWDINPRSIQGLIKGVAKNKLGQVYHVKRHEPLLWQRFVEARCVVLEESNEFFLERLHELMAQTGRDRFQHELEIKHVNLGMLPSSEPIWVLCCDMVNQLKLDNVWFHVHDNVHVDAEHDWKRRLEATFETETARRCVLKWVEHIKTYAPDVWHVVGDLLVTSAPLGEQQGPSEKFTS